MGSKAMQEPTFLILTSLAGGTRHGYGVMQDIEQMSAKRKLRPGTLYSALERLCTDGLVEVDREEVDGSRLRRYYRLTDMGAAQLSTEAERLISNAALAQKRLAGPATGPAVGIA